MPQFTASVPEAGDCAGTTEGLSLSDVDFLVHDGLYFFDPSLIKKSVPAEFLEEDSDGLCFEYFA